MHDRTSSIGVWPASVKRFVRAARRVYPKSGLKDAADRALFVMRSVSCHPAADEWYAWLDEPLMAPVARANPSLYKKIIRPYLTPGCTNDEKLSILRAHYRYLSSQVTRSAFLDICSRNGLELARFNTSDGDSFRLRCLSDGKFRKEGEHSLVLFSERHDVPVSSMTFVLRRQTDGACVLLIGGTQGLPKRADKSVIKDVTKSFHGLRPRAFLLFVAQQLGAAWHLDGIRALGNATHVSRHRDYALNRARRPRLAYDELWLESGGVPAEDGLYDLPRRHASRSMSEIKTNKRSQYQQRYALLDRLAVVLQLGLARLGVADVSPPPAAPVGRALVST